MGTLSFAKHHLGFPSSVSRETEAPITEPDITLIMVVVICTLASLGAIWRNLLQMRCYPTTLSGDIGYSEWRLNRDRETDIENPDPEPFLGRGGGANITVMIES